MEKAHTFEPYEIGYTAQAKTIEGVRNMVLQILAQALLVNLDHIDKKAVLSSDLGGELYELHCKKIDLREKLDIVMANIAKVDC